MQPLTKQTLKIWWQHTKRYKYAIAFVGFGIFLNSSFGVVETYLVRILVNAFADKQYDKMLEIVWYITGIAVVANINWRSVGYMVNYFQPRVMSDLLNTCYEYIFGHSRSFFTNNFTGSIQTRIRRYQGSYERFTDTLMWNMSGTVLSILLILGVLSTKKPAIGLVFLLWTLLFGVSVYFIAKKKMKYDLNSAEQETKTSAHLADTLTNNVNIKLFSSKNTEVKSYRRLTQKLFESRRKAWNLGNHWNAFQGAAMVLLQFVVLRLLVRYASMGRLTIGDFVLIETYMLQIFDQLWGFGNNIKNIYESFADANEMTEMLLEPHAIIDTAGALPIRVAQGLIEFENVGFYYTPDNPIFRKFNLRIESGQKLAVVGPSGAGKSTIVNLLLRFEDVKAGVIRIDGQDISKVTQDSLRNAIAFVPQDPILFHRTLMENIRYGRPDATDKEVIAAAKLAHAHEFISKCPDKYATFVGERGVKLSGGERQRVAIARAILKDAPILILDEATSSLDSESESLIQQALHNLMQGRTTIAIAHRLSTIREADRIIVLEEGKITEEGAHEVLVQMEEGTYRRLWEIQTSGYEAVVK